MHLTTQQIAYFQQFGYLIIPQLFSAAEITAISGHFERTLATCGPSNPSAGKGQQLVLGPIQHLPEMNAILDHPGILDLAGGILGDDFNYAMGDGRNYSGDTPWHPDGSWGQLFSAKIAIYLDPLTRATGALQVIPGSHDPHHPLRRRLQAMGGPAVPGRSRARPMLGLQGIQDECGFSGTDFPGARALETNPGDVLIFNHDTFHASFGGGQRRRMFTMNLTRHCTTAEDLQLLREYLSTHSPGGFTMPIGGMYFNPILETAGAKRMRHLEQCRALHDELFPQQKATLTHRQQVESMLRTFHPEPKVDAAKR